MERTNWNDSAAQLKNPDASHDLMITNYEIMIVRVVGQVALQER